MSSLSIPSYHTKFLRGLYGTKDISFLGEGNVGLAVLVRDAVMGVGDEKCFIETLAPSKRGGNIVVKLAERMPETPESRIDVVSASLRNEFVKARYLHSVYASQAVTYGRREIGIVLPNTIGSDEEGVTSWIETPYAEGSETFSNYLAHLPTELKANINFCIEVFKQMISALRDCHRAGITHGDVSLANTLIFPEKQKLVLIDLGLSRFIDREVAINENDIGFKAWGPERTLDPDLKEGGLAKAYNDVYSLGYFFFDVLMTVFLEQNGECSLNDENFKSLIEAGVPSNLIHLIQKMASKDPAERPDLMQCLGIIGNISLSESTILINTSPTPPHNSPHYSPAPPADGISSPA